MDTGKIDGAGGFQFPRIDLSTVKNSNAPALFPEDTLLLYSKEPRAEESIYLNRFPGSLRCEAEELESGENSRVHYIPPQEKPPEEAQFKKKFTALKRAGFTFHVQKQGEPEKEVTPSSLFSLYSEKNGARWGLTQPEKGSSAGQMILLARRGGESITLPGTSEDPELLSFFYLRGEASILKNPETALKMRQFHQSGNSFLLHASSEASARKSNPLEAYARVTWIADNPMYNAELYFFDGVENGRIDSPDDFTIACALAGAMDESKLTAPQKKALSMVSDMRQKGVRFADTYDGTQDKGPLAVLKAALQCSRFSSPVRLLDEKGRGARIERLEDLERAYGINVTRDLSAFPEKEREVLSLADAVLAGGFSFHRTVPKGSSCGAVDVAGRILRQTDNHGLDTIYFQDRRGLSSSIDSIQDLRRIKAIYLDHDLSTLPQQEQKIILALQKIYDSPGLPIAENSYGLLTALKRILGETDYISSVGIVEERPRDVSIYEKLILPDTGPPKPDKKNTVLKENIESLEDAERFIGYYIDKDFSGFPLEEREMLEYIQALRSAGYAFFEKETWRGRSYDNHEPPAEIAPLQLPGILKANGGKKWRTSIQVVSPSGEFINNIPCELESPDDLRRAHIMLIKKDTTLLTPEEQQLLSLIRELSKKGIKLPANMDPREMEALKTLIKSEYPLEVKFKGGRTDHIENARDMALLQALYLGGDQSLFTPDEKRALDILKEMNALGYTGAELYSNTAISAPEYTALKCAARGKDSFGFTDSRGAFAEISSQREIKLLKAIHRGENRESFMPRDRAIIELLHNHLAQGYTIEADSTFSAVDSLGKKVNPSDYVPVIALEAFNGLKEGRSGLYFSKDGNKLPLSRYQDLITAYDRVTEEKDEENGIMVDEGFVFFGTMRLDINN